MRFSNTGTGSRSSWETYASNKTWILSAGYGTKTVYAQFSLNGNGIADISTNDSITYQAAAPSNSCVGGHCADITLRIVASGQSYCEYGESLDLGMTGYSASTRDISSAFLTTGSNSGWFCDDLNGTGESRVMNIQATDLFNISTNNAIHTISNANLFIKNTAATTVLGNCTANPGLSLDERTAMDGIIPILGKLGNAGEVCKVQTDNVALKVSIPAYQAVGQYSGMLIIDLPNF